jgi:TetR/AcrR family transcriptional regulator
MFNHTDEAFTRGDICSAAMPKSPRRAPAREQRRLDPERSRAALLEAARIEFAAKGYAGARVAEIAERAGLNSQLITYYFGGKAGLYQDLQRQWLVAESRFADTSLPLAELTVRYLQEELRDSSWARLALWSGLAEDASPPSPLDQEDLSDLQRRQREGEIAPELDPAAVLLILIGAVSAPIALPDQARRITGMDPESPEFAEHYAEQLRRVILRLGVAPADDGD